MIRLLCLSVLWAGAAFGQDLTALARLDMAQSRVEVGAATSLELHLSQPVPWRVMTLVDPPRLLLEFREVEWTGTAPSGLTTAGVELARPRPGVSTFTLLLPGPQVVRSAGMAVDPTSGTATVAITMEPTSVAAFVAAATPQAGPDLRPSAETDVPSDGPLMVVIDPGHGGIDPGAERNGVREADLMLRLGVAVAEALQRRAGITAQLTRQADVFVPLQTRMTIARAAGADLFISLHADALEEDLARGASVYTLSQAGADAASARMAERHERGDLIGGLDLSGQGDRVATALMDIARLETGPAGLRFADALVAGLERAGVPLNSRPRRTGRLAVLNAADFPSVLLEAGFLSSDADRQRLQTPDGRAAVASAIADAVEVWATEEALRAPLNRQ